MAAQHAFVDESVRRDYLLCAVVVNPEDLANTRRIVRSLCGPGQHRVHMKRESARRRRAILSTVSTLGVTAHVYRTQLGAQSARLARDRCLQAMLPDLLEFDVSRLVVEACEQDHRDNQVIREMVIKNSMTSDFEYLHASPAAEPLLWLPDIVAWACGRGGDWLRRTGPVVDRLTCVEP